MESSKFLECFLENKALGDFPQYSLNESMTMEEEKILEGRVVQMGYIKEVFEVTQDDNQTMTISLRKEKVCNLNKV